MEVDVVQVLAFVVALAFSFPALADSSPSQPEASTIAQHMEWSRKFVREPDTTGSLAGGTLSDTGHQKCPRNPRLRPSAFQLLGAQAFLLEAQVAPRHGAMREDSAGRGARA